MRILREWKIIDCQKPAKTQKPKEKERWGEYFTPVEPSGEKKTGYRTYFKRESISPKMVTWIYFPSIIHHTSIPLTFSACDQEYHVNVVEIEKIIVLIFFTLGGCTSMLYMLYFRVL